MSLTCLSIFMEGSGKSVFLLHYLPNNSEFEFAWKKIFEAIFYVYNK